MKLQVINEYILSAKQFKLNKDNPRYQLLVSNNE